MEKIKQPHFITTTLYTVLYQFDTSIEECVSGKNIYYFAFKGEIKEKNTDDLPHYPFKPPDKQNCQLG